MGEILRQSLGQLGAGFNSLGQAIRSGQARDDRLAQEEFRREQEKSLQGRLDAAASQVGTIVEQAQDPAFTREDFIKAAAPIFETAIATRNPALSRPLDAVEAIFKGRAEAQAESSKTTRAEGKEKKADIKEAKIAKGKQFDRTRVLRKDFSTDDTTKATKKVTDSFSRIKRLTAAKPSGANDLGVIFNFMKMLDPGSVVRESEFKSAAGIRSFLAQNGTVNPDGSMTIEREGQAFQVPAFAAQLFQKLDPQKKGSFLLPEQRASFLASAEELQLAQLQNQVGIDNNFIALSGGLGIDPFLVIGKDNAQTKLEALEQTRAERAASSAAAQPEIPTTEDKQSEKPNFKAIDGAAFDRLKADPKNLQAVQTLIDQENQELAAKGLPPLTPQEESIRVNAVLEGNGLRVQQTKRP